jgi:hypothetical protein
MIKSFAMRAITPVAVSITGFVILGCVVLFSFVRSELVTLAVQRQHDLVETIKRSTHHAMLKGDRESLREIVREVGKQEGVTHLRIFNKVQGTITFSSDPKEVGKPLDQTADGCIECHAGSRPLNDLGPMEQNRWYTDGAGIRVMAVTVPLFNLPECSSAPCHAHAPSLRVLGTMDIGLSQQGLGAALWRVAFQMAIFCLMVLILSIAGVSALLWRNVFLPIKELVEYTHHTSAPQEVGFKPHGGADIEALVRDIREMADVCREANAMHMRQKERAALSGPKPPSGSRD